MKENIIYGFLSFFISLFLLKYLIGFQKSKNIGKYIRKEGPSKHFEKTGTPIIGGIIFLLSLLPFLFFKETRFFSICVLSFGLLGLIDDLKLLRNKDYGIRPLRKLIITFIISVILFSIYSPFDYRILWGSHLLYESKLLYFLLFIVLFMAIPNAVNLTDGLDGLAGSTTFASLLALLFINPSNNLLSVGIIVLLGALMGFLWYNIHPAQIFMSDVGAFALGGAIAAVSVEKKLELLMIFVCGIFLLESLSVFIQVFFYKWKKRRVFLMSPLHHHFELKGWNETKIVGRFFIIHLVMMLGGILLWV
ncbi:MAG TPA: phospho-N-acetylmuramoyl-pentapeptide-transferase [Dictyoglomaceae bacterium]|nr:phospho-N-acetylmuramoyl-pentapeptide-transferase [Dictyoglomaceae bacterium]HOL38864.1 phospho-N-acetylmuramoyl-pentapeptide-transferase [Dictyoglomaceae bacterium]HOP95391.1 phospho-N-acetylmuramoyl-pentapeptide-transferase [Dictyoglomaceae bacterium]HPP15719.1 phospho-N-acetylmuramoyl-pentapeptide-transferase [Dictyoglomaceae bacterium]HPU43717.1 phospho-N-acetylmuramoyl-pentapeptide-transferase [Dictyoglomaceae bacterium]